MRTGYELRDTCQRATPLVPGVITGHPAWAVLLHLLGLATSDYAPRYVRACRLVVVPRDLVTHCS
jgi:hypothetical protein